MSLAQFPGAVDDSVVSEISAEARRLREAGDTGGGSTYIAGYAGEFLEDAAAIQRAVRAHGGDVAEAARSMARTVAWREENKVYPARRDVDGAALAVDGRGMVVVRARQTGVLPRRRQQGGGDAAWRAYARGIDALEDARVALKAAHRRFGAVMQAAVVVAVESVALSDVTADAVARVAEVAAAHYAGAVGRVYVTAASGVLLEHARHALRPALQALAAPPGFVVFAPADFAVFAPEDYGVSAPEGCGVPDGFAPEDCGVPDDFAPSSSGDSDTCTDADFCSAVSVASGKADAAASGGDAFPPQAMPSAQLASLQLASLQRAVRGVQRVLGSIGDSVAAADSRLALAASRSSLCQQADVLMSAVAALSFGVSMASAPPAPPAPPKRVPPKPALDLVRLLARHGGALAMLRRLAAAAARRVPSARVLLLLGYKHLRFYAVVLWTGALLAWHANAALIWSNLTAQWRRGIAW
ncbi:hypothetical protein H4R26_004324 [Coemansia thaxteri]|uniref:CRAL-TRIO domain-containing protein n=1 Tax=Coemansia thaxteri TaxID=2663907 RepID=A0A9W8BAW7_9FUNG|nr:hypothetical protein H4R26_004324 [Coemansia thaxteri]